MKKTVLFTLAVVVILASACRQGGMMMGNDQMMDHMRRNPQMMQEMMRDPTMKQQMMDQMTKNPEQCARMMGSMMKDPNACRIMVDEMGKDADRCRNMMKAMAERMSPAAGQSMMQQCEQMMPDAAPAASTAPATGSGSSPSR